MTIQEIYTNCLNIDPDAYFYIFIENGSNIMNQTGGTFYKHYNDLPDLYRRKPVQRFEISELGCTVYVEFKS